jgi:hypothetical protein
VFLKAAKQHAVVFEAAKQQTALPAVFSTRLQAAGDLLDKLLSGEKTVIGRWDAVCCALLQQQQPWCNEFVRRGTAGLASSP